MRAERLFEIIGSDFYTGVPDSQLKALCNFLMHKYGINSKHHIIAANEGNAVALAAGYHLATGKVAVVYMQNSGEGNAINPIASLLNENVYAIPVVFIVGWRGEPGVHDEPQHVFQGEVTVKLFEDMGVSTFIIGMDTKEENLREVMRRFQNLLGEGKSVAFIVRKGGLTYDEKVSYQNDNTILREDVIAHIANIASEDIIVSTTGKTSRELFEIRTRNQQSHKYDFLTVGSMGHSSSIALGIALNKLNSKIWCIDGDGAVLMHMGAMAVIGTNAPPNMVHILINNCAHETVGGMPTVAYGVDMVGIAKACGYPKAVSVCSLEDLNRELAAAKVNDMLTFVEVKCSLGAREDLGRPTTTAEENKELFMRYLSILL